MRSLKLAVVNIKKNFLNARELKSAFIISVIGMILNNFSFTLLWLYFGNSVGVLNGFSPMDIFGIYAINTTAYGLVHSFMYGLFNIPSYISSGNFDKFLITPKNTLIKVVTSDISTSAFGDLLFGVICFVIFLLSTKLSMIGILLMILFTILAAVIFFSFSLICMSISFYLMDGENISNGLYSMFVGSSLYHGGAFTGVLKAIFIFIIPSLLLGAVPLEIVLNYSFYKVLLLIGLTLFWLVFSIYFFYKSLRKYESNNFFGFGG